MKSSVLQSNTKSQEKWLGSLVSFILVQTTCLRKLISHLIVYNHVARKFYHHLIIPIWISWSTKVWAIYVRKPNQFLMTVKPVSNVVPFVICRPWKDRETYRTSCKIQKVIDGIDNHFATKINACFLSFNNKSLKTNTLLRFV